MRVTSALASGTALVVAVLGAGTVVDGAAAAGNHGHGGGNGASHAGPKGNAGPAPHQNHNNPGHTGQPANPGGNHNPPPNPPNPPANPPANPGNSGNHNPPANPGNSGNHNPPANPGNSGTPGQPADPGNSGDHAHQAGDQGVGNGGGHNPPGNNGTIKVDGLAFDDAPNNEPHVGCTFQIDFYGFDEGDLYADVSFVAQAPTTSPSGADSLLSDSVFIGEDDASGGGSEAGLDASKTYTLDFGDIAPHPQQGYHVKLTIHADGSQGADVKHKVFWVAPCTGGSDTDVEGNQGNVTPDENELQPPADDIEVEGEQATTGDSLVVGDAAGDADTADVPTAVDAGGDSTVDWVLSPVPLLVIGLGIVVLAIGIAARRRHV